MKSMKQGRVEEEGVSPLADPVRTGWAGGRAALAPDTCKEEWPKSRKQDLISHFEIKYIFSEGKREKKMNCGIVSEVIAWLPASHTGSSSQPSRSASGPATC